MNALPDIKITIRAEVRRGTARAESVTWEVTAGADEPVEAVHGTVTTTLRQINEQLKGLIK